MSTPKRIGAVARELGINPKTIRYYEAIDLIPPAQRTPQGYRIYTQAEIDRLAFILRARALDFSLDDIREILAFRERGEAPCLHVAGLVAQRITEIEAKIAALQQLRDDLQHLHEQAAALPLETLANKDCICHLIENQRLIEQKEIPVRG